MTQDQRDIAQRAKVLGDQLTVASSHAAAERITDTAFQAMLDTMSASLTQIAADFTPDPEP